VIQERILQDENINLSNWVRIFTLMLLPPSEFESGFVYTHTLYYDLKLCNKLIIFFNEMLLINVTNQLTCWNINLDI